MEESELIEKFQAAQLPNPQWTHRAHLQVALHYLTQFAPEQALERLRRDIQNLNIFHGVYTTADGGYHETRTRVWLAVLFHELQEGTPTEAIIEKYARCDVARDYYSKELLDSWEARIDWVASDISILPVDPGGWCKKTPTLFTLKGDGATIRQSEG
jgi:hypothetical protein